MAGDAVLDDLLACVDGHAREAGPDDAVAGVPARWYAEPASTQEAAALLGVAARAGLSVVPRGRGTALGWGTPPRSADLVVGTTRMNAVVEHEAGDLVCVVDAGATLDAVDAAVSPHGQMLALDQPVPGATVGGTVSTARSGPRRVLYGTPRDQVLGVTMVRADGTTATAGSKVVKNVAGYDLAKLLGGAFGTLGLITRLVVRLHPRPRAQRWLRATFEDGAGGRHDAGSGDGPLRAAAAARRVVGSQVAPTAVEVRRTPDASSTEVHVLLEGTEPGVDDRSRQTVDLLDGAAAGSEADSADLARLPLGEHSTLLKVAVPIPLLGDVLRTVSALQRGGLSVHAQGSAVGVVHVVVDDGGSAGDVARAVDELRRTAVDGSAVVLQAPPQVRSLVDVWGPVNGLDLMRRVKHEFDPDHRLSPGRFVGGI